jgi:hypothetical protein
MTPDTVSQLMAPFFANGAIGVVCIALAWISLRLWGKVEKLQAEHKIELAGKDALIKELYDARVEEAKVGYEILKSNEKSQAAFLVAVNGRTVA